MTTPRDKHGRRRRICGFGFGLGLGLAGLALSAQQPSLGVLRNFSWPDYFPPPHETQLRFLLKGAEARPRAEGQIVVSNAVVEKYLETGVREVLIETPECVFDPETRDVHSRSSLKVQFEDGRLVLEGEGFSWQQTNALLVVSNRVRTQLRGGGLAVKPQATSAMNLLTLSDTEIRGDRFQYDYKGGLAVYRGHVRVASSNLSLDCGTLTFKLSAPGTNELEWLTAEEAVSIRQDALQATGGRAVYTPSNGVLHLTEQASWRAQGREGRGNELVLNSVSKSMQVHDNAWMRLPAGAAGFVPQQGEAPGGSGATNRFVIVTAQRYALTTNQASFHGMVRVSERVEAEELAHLSCERLVATLGASNELHGLVAEQRVVIVEGQRRLTGERAFFEGTSGMLELTGQPTWQDGAYSGEGSVLVADLHHNRLKVRGGAGVVLPRAQTDALLGAFAMKPRQTPSPVVKTNVAVEPQFARVFCDEYEFSPEMLKFRGNVRVEDAQMQLTSEALDVRLSPGGTNVVSLVADRNVVMSLVETNNQITRATCARVLYTGTNDVLTLSGDPVVHQCTTDATNTFSADDIVVDRRSGSIRTLGTIRGHLLVPANDKTNAAALPFGPTP